MKVPRRRSSTPRARQVRPVPVCPAQVVPLVLVDCPARPSTMPLRVPQVRRSVHRSRMPRRSRSPVPVVRVALVAVELPVVRVVPVAAVVPPVAEQAARVLAVPVAVALRVVPVALVAVALQAARVVQVPVVQAAQERAAQERAAVRLPVVPALVAALRVVPVAAPLVLAVARAVLVV
ncbi:hypothetical protein [Mycolicibacterium neoaurum]|uniref:hypothetical protein n=1 Tax=Mycolicibacterium neoaurum TaxID=1795 RepID=UPI00114D4D24|nr:hypothetical protein [Mycolicibacterium neoaurum]